MAKKSQSVSKKIWHTFYWIAKKMIAPRVKTQAKSQNYSSRALKWGILCICILNTFGATIKCEKRLVFQFLRFCKKVTKSLYKIAKN